MQQFLLSSASSFYTTHPTAVNNLQRLLTRAIENEDSRQLRAEASPEGVARLHSASGSYSSAWITAFPLEQSVRLSNHAYQLAARRRLGLPPCSDMPSRCACGASFILAPYHADSCVRLRRTVVDHRHNMVVNEVAAWARRAGGTALTEPAGLSFEDGRRPDILIRLGAQSFMIDVTVRHPTAPSHVAAAQTPLEVARRAEREKRALYDQLARDNHCRFVPFVIESFGAFGAAAVDFVKLIAGHAEEAGSQWSRHEVLFGVISAVQVAVQSGNAMTTTQGFQTAAQAPSSSSRRVRR